tara:strand:- start:57054 stop:57503 length:450 start_codon:yes stop_codon:yes gene_type:complete
MLKKTFTILIVVITTLFAVQTYAAKKLAHNVKISDGYIRMVPNHLRVTASYLTINNTSSHAIYLVSATSPLAKSVQLHKTEKVNGMMRMVQQQQIEIPAHDKFQFKPGAYHVMFIGMDKPIYVGEIVPVTLCFKDTSCATVNMPVKSDK